MHNAWPFYNIMPERVKVKTFFEVTHVLIYTDPFYKKLNNKSTQNSKHSSYLSLYLVEAH